jgi:hypothetical protein
VKALPILVLISIFSGCGLSPCVDRVVSELPSPDGENVAVIFERDCGETTLKNIQVCLRKKSDAFDSKLQRSCFICEGDGATASWASSGKLIIRFASDSKVFRKETEQHGLQISYEAR